MPVAGAIAGGVASAAAGKLLGGDDDGPAYQQSSLYDAAAADAVKRQADIADKTFKHFEDNFMPFEENILLPTGKKLIEDSEKFGSKAEQDEAAGQASAAVTQATSKARGMMDRNMASYGINPASGRFGDASTKFALEGAKMDAGAQNLARKGVRDDAFGKRMTAITGALNIDAVGRGLPATAMAGFGSAASANAGLATNMFNRNQFLQDQARQGVAPLVSAISQGVSRWFNPSSSGGMPPPWSTPPFNPDVNANVG